MTEREISVYAIVRCGGRQEKASVDDVLTVDKLAGEPGSTLTLPAVLVVDDGKVIREGARKLRDPAFLAGANRYPDDPLRYEKALIDRWLEQELTGR